MIEIEGKKRPDKMPPNPTYLVLKDAWVNSRSMTEGEVQRELFRDIATFAKDPAWRENPLLSHIRRYAPEHLEELAGYLKDDTFKKLFLNITAEWTGSSSFDIHENARMTAEIFYDPFPADDPYSTSLSQSARSAGRTGSVSRPLSADEVHEGEDPHKRPYRAFAPRKRCFLVFNDICTRIQDLPTIGNVMFVGRQCSFGECTFPHSLPCN